MILSSITSMVEGNSLKIFSYVGQSSFSHQTYTRKWVQVNRVPVISIDYCKPPMHPYPAPLDDCWQTYNWLLYESHKYYCLRPDKKIILAGDSAGGNLILSLTNLIILMGAPLPNYLLPFYPCKLFSLLRLITPRCKIFSMLLTNN
jgi:hormone-sensitive lipase